jgi:hypothetical protein
MTLSMNWLSERFESSIDSSYEFIMDVPFGYTFFGG